MSKEQLLMNNKFFDVMFVTFPLEKQQQQQQQQQQQLQKKCELIEQCRSLLDIAALKKSFLQF